MRLSKSKYWYTRGKKVLPNVAQTLSKSQSQFPFGEFPIFLSRGWDSTVVDVDGNQYIDYIGALGPVILGYDNQAVNGAIKKQLYRGISFSLPHILSVQLAEKLVNIIPCAEQVRFMKNGSDACSAAIRIARAYTNRSQILTCGYHGADDWFISTTDRNRGAYKDYRIMPFEYNNIHELEDWFATTTFAAVIMEPMSMEYPNEGYLERVRELCNENKTLLIFDEVVTGFRVAISSV